MSIRILILLLAVAVGLLPGAAAAQEEDDEDEGFIFVVDNPVLIGPDDQVGTIIAINSDTNVAGTVTDALVVINGDAVVAGRVSGTITVISGNLALGDRAVVEDVSLIDSDLDRAPGATVTGDIDRREDVAFGFGTAAVISSILFWLAASVAVIVAGLLFAAVGGLQLSTSAALIARDFGFTVLTALVVWIGIPIIAVLAFLTVIGIPLGIGLLIFLLPALWFLGYLVFGTWFGAVILGAFRRTATAEHPYLAAVVGLVILQLILLIPFLGWLVVLIAGLLGAGALVLLAWRAWRGRGTREPVPAA